MNQDNLLTAALTVNTRLPAGDRLTQTPLQIDRASLGSHMSADHSKLAAVQTTSKTQLLWFNSTTGATTSWVMEGTTRTAERTINPDSPLTDLNWKIVGTGDFNRDGQDDILWRNAVNGENAWWVMAGSRINSVVYLTQITDLNWTVVGANDYNRDGQIDLLWRNSATGENGWWIMKGAITETVVMTPPERDLNKDIVGIGDYNRDGQLDLLWRDRATGENSWWVMNGSSILDKPILLPVPPDSNWQPIGTRDFNTDGQGDIVWHNAITGANTLWLMNGSAIANTLALPSADLKLQLVGFLNQSSDLAPQVSIIPVNVAALMDADTLASADLQSAVVFSLSNQVSDRDPSDFYRFNVSQSGVFTANLTGLTGDADVRLIQDKNQNGALDADEILAWQWERGPIAESIRRFLSAGDYFVQVMSYNAQVADYSLATTFTPAATDDQAFGFGITFGQSLVTGLTQSARDAIISAAAFWENVIPSRSAIANSQVLDVTIVGQSLTNSDGTADTGTLALSGPQFGLEGPNLVINGGSSTLNLRRLADFNTDPNYLRDIMIHEFAHILGFGTLWEAVRFRSSDGTIFEVGKDLIDLTTVTYKANTYAGWAYGGLLGTFVQTAVPIEPQIFAHWDESRFDPELMTPFAEVPGVVMPIGELTLASLRDLGWNINMGAAQAYSLPNAPVVNA